MPTRWTGSPESYQSHSAIEIEHRLTTQHLVHEHLQDAHDDLLEDVEALRKRLALHEKAILGILGLLQIVFQDKYPALAAALKALTP